MNTMRTLNARYQLVFPYPGLARDFGPERRITTGYIYALQ